MFQPLAGLPAVPIVIPFAKWQEAANSDVFTNQPRKY